MIFMFYTAAAAAATLPFLATHCEPHAGALCGSFTSWSSAWSAVLTPQDPPDFSYLLRMNGHRPVGARAAPNTSANELADEREANNRLVKLNGAGRVDGAVLAHDDTVFCYSSFASAANADQFESSDVQGAAAASQEQVGPTQVSRLYAGHKSIERYTLDRTRSSYLQAPGSHAALDIAGALDCILMILDEPDYGKAAQIDCCALRAPATPLRDAEWHHLPSSQGTSPYDASNRLKTLDSAAVIFDTRCSSCSSISMSIASLLVHMSSMRPAKASVARAASRKSFNAVESSELSKDSS